MTRGSPVGGLVGISGWNDRPHVWMAAPLSVMIRLLYRTHGAIAVTPMICATLLFAELSTQWWQPGRSERSTHAGVPTAGAERSTTMRCTSDRRGMHDASCNLGQDVALDAPSRCVCGSLTFPRCRQG